MKYLPVIVFDLLGAVMLTIGYKSVSFSVLFYTGGVVLALIAGMLIPQKEKKYSF